MLSDAYRQVHRQTERYYYFTLQSIEPGTVLTEITISSLPQEHCKVHILLTYHVMKL